MTNEFDDNVDLTVFSLVCQECDAGSNVLSHADAVAAGWAEIEYRPDLPMANYLGLCPDCRRDRELRDYIERQDQPIGP